MQMLEKHSDEIFPCKIYKLKVGRAQQTGGIWLRCPPSLMELLDNGCSRLLVIEICVGKLVLMLLAKLSYQMQTFFPWVPQREKKKHVKLVWGSHVVIYLNMSTTVAFRNTFPS